MASSLFRSLDLQSQLKAVVGGTKRILLISMGGTIAKIRRHGLLNHETADEDETLSFLTPEQQAILAQLGVVEAVSLFSGDSTLMKPEDWAKLAGTIVDRAHEFDGFVITHGTDSLAYTASVLSWMLGNIGKPVVITGAQIAMRDTASLRRSDGWANLVNAVRVAQDGRIIEVSVVFGSRILRGNRTTKSDMFGLDAFDSPNYPDLGRIGIDVAYSPKYQPPHNALSGASIPTHWPRVVTVKAFPGLDVSVLRSAIASGVEGYVIEAYPSGLLPPELMEVLADSGGVCVVCLSGKFGPADVFYYEPTYWLETNYVVSGRDMTFEAAITKLMWALAIADNREQSVSLMKTVVAGEMQADIRPFQGRTAVEGAGRQPAS